MQEKIVRAPWRKKAADALARTMRGVRRTLNAELNHLSYNLQALDGLGIPEVFQVELTNHCPMRCVMCPRTHGMTRLTGHMAPALFERIIRELAPHSARIFLHHFGDSLTHPALGECMRYATRHGVATYLSANPILLTEQRIRDVVDGGLSELVLSLDGATPATSAAIRGAAARDVAEAERRVAALLEYRKARKSVTPRIVLQFVRQKANEHEVDAWLAKWSRVGDIEIKVKSFVTWDGRNERINSMRPRAAPDSANVVCDKPWTSVTILWDGRVVPCCFDHDARYELGNLRDQSLREICVGEPMRRLRDAHRRRALGDVALCAKCVDKEGYPVGKWYYPLNRLLASRHPLGDADMSASHDQRIRK